MSVNNLSEHLNWLLRQEASVPPPETPRPRSSTSKAAPVPAPPPETLVPDTIYEAEDFNDDLLDDFEPNIPDPIAATTRLGREKEGVPQFERPPVAAEPSMAKLRSPPSPSRRVQSAGLNNIIRSTLESNGAQHSTALDAFRHPLPHPAVTSSSTPTKPSIDFHARSPDRPPSSSSAVRPKLTFKAPPEFCMIDLTQDEDKVKIEKSSATPASSKTLFKHPQALYERSAVKRTSEEFERDMTPPVHPPRSSPPRTSRNEAQSLGKAEDDEPLSQTTRVIDANSKVQQTAQAPSSTTAEKSSQSPKASSTADTKSPKLDDHNAYFNHSDTDVSMEHYVQDFKIIETPMKPPPPPQAPPQSRNSTHQGFTIADSDQDTESDEGSDIVSAPCNPPARTPVNQRKRKSPSRSPLKTLAAKKVQSTTPSTSATSALTKTPTSSQASFMQLQIEDELPVFELLGEDPRVAAFIKTPGQVLRRYHQELLQAFNQAKRELIRGVDTEQGPSLERAAREISGKLRNFSTLMSARVELAELMAKRSERQDEMEELVASTDMFGEEWDAVKQALAALRGPIQGLEATLGDLVARLNLDCDSLLNPQAARSPTATIDVCATQAFGGRAAHPAGTQMVPSSTDLVGQTQLQRPVQRGSTLGGPPPMSHRGNTSISNHQASPDLVRGFALNREPHAIPPNADDAFEEYFDDDICFDAIDDIEDVDTAAQPGASRFAGTRPALQERSPNAMAPSPGHRSSLNKTLAANGPEYCKPWSVEVTKIMTEKFHMRGFRKNQIEAINATLAGEDAFVLMPTGGGKSLCYQLPAIVKSGKTSGVTVVISPLVSLMDDQVAHLHKLGVRAQLINSSLGLDMRRQILGALRSSQPESFIELLYITPEMLQKSDALMEALASLHQNQKFARLVIDEAHCVSQWGHDFRPDYKLIGGIRDRFPGVPFMALTATATPNVQADVIHNLKIEGCRTFTQSFNRPNLYYEIRAKTKGMKIVEEIAELINRKHRNQCGIIYCLSRKSCEKVAAELRGAGISAHHYHAQVPADEKSRIQSDWQSGRHQVIVATIAFGMGIDKPNVRFVIHHSMPKTLEGYYQETGRAGRDAYKSFCYLYYSYGDFRVMQQMIQKSEGNREQKERLEEMLRYMIQFCDNTKDCRRSQVLGYFGERSFNSDECNNQCDNCKARDAGARYDTIDCTDLAKSAFALVRDITGELKGSRRGYTRPYLLDLFNGKHNKNKEPAHADAAGFGAGKGLERGDSDRLFTRLLTEDIFEEEQVTNRGGFVTAYVKLGRRQNKVRQPNFKIELIVKEGQGRRSKPAASNVASEKGQPEPKTKKRKAVPKANAASTYVSSPPVQDAARQQAQAGPSRLRQYAFDDEESDDAFETMPTRPGRSVRRSNNGRDPQLTEPIQTDVQMDRLEPWHRELVERWVNEARKEGQNIMRKCSLKSVPFSDTVLRHCALAWPTTLGALRNIQGIKEDMVDAHGKRLLQVLDPFNQQYMAALNEHLNDHRQFRIADREVQFDLVDDDDDDGPETGYRPDDIPEEMGDDLPLDDYDGNASEKSRFFDGRRTGKGTEVINLDDDDDEADPYGSFDLSEGVSDIEAAASSSHKAKPARRSRTSTGSSRSSKVTKRASASRKRPSASKPRGGNPQWRGGGSTSRGASAGASTGGSRRKKNGQQTLTRTAGGGISAMPT